MVRYNEHFILNTKEIDLVEQALREQIAKLSSANLSGACPDADANERKMKELHELLGKLHNKKIWWGQVHNTGVPLG
ncbi:hypothetical protein [Methylocaldum sp.]|uniref:hypothetical protein n=1 Tax=Methylocaldum sp. TaxID=1969727 RepID=UPI002D3153D4|nr:hypothetical protein [Methylocaldum sp.]HYE34755.1 hypothetical protein [Methylocaldum sp.]